MLTIPENKCYKTFFVSICFLHLLTLLALTLAGKVLLIITISLWTDKRKHTVTHQCNDITLTFISILLNIIIFCSCFISS